MSPDGTGYSRAVAGSFEVTRLVFPPFATAPSSPSGVPGRRPRRRSRKVVRRRHHHPVSVEHRNAARRCCALECVCPALDADSRNQATDSQASALFGALLSRQRHLQAAVSTTLGWRMACELESRDAGWSLALEGLVLQLLAATGRVAEPTPVRSTGGYARLATCCMNESLGTRRSPSSPPPSAGPRPTSPARFGASTA